MTAIPQPQLRVEPGDRHAEDVQALLVAAEALSQSLYPPQSIHMLDAGELDREDVLFLVAREPHGPALGCGAIVLQGQQAAELKRMFVAATARRRGVAARILTELEVLAREHGVTVLRLETGVSQPEAIALYERFGFRHRGPFGNYEEDPLSIFMQKTLY